jgi:hypothetical protein
MSDLMRGHLHREHPSKVRMSYDMHKCSRSATHPTDIMSTVKSFETFCAGYKTHTAHEPSHVQSKTRLRPRSLHADSGYAAKQWDDYTRPLHSVWAGKETLRPGSKPLSASASVIWRWMNDDQASCAT